MIELLNIDCMEYMKTCEDNAFDLAIVDPPYGIKADKGTGSSNLAKSKKYSSEWDSSVPSIEYFNELFRISINQIIWGVNYYPYDLSGGRIVWDKDNTGNFSDCELAFSSFGYGVRKYKFKWNGMIQGDMKNKEKRIHPTQKPVALYRWLLDNYAKPNDRILDTHAGSFSSAVACKEKGFSGVFCELDKDYFKDGKARVDKASRQYELTEVIKETPENIELFNQHDVGCKAVE